MSRQGGAVSAAQRRAYIGSVLAAVESRLDGVIDEYEAAGRAVPDPEAFADIVVDLTLGPVEVANPLVELLSPFWSSAKARRELGNVSRQALDSAMAHGRLLGLKSSDGRLLFPVFQFVRAPADADGAEATHRIEVREGIKAMLKVLRAAPRWDPWAFAVLYNTPADELDDLTPLEWERSGRPVGALTDLAARIDHDWAA